MAPNGHPQGWAGSIPARGTSASGEAWPLIKGVGMDIIIYGIALMAGYGVVSGFINGFRGK